MNDMNNMNNGNYTNGQNQQIPQYPMSQQVQPVPPAQKPPKKHKSHTTAKVAAILAGVIIVGGGAGFGGAYFANRTRVPTAAETSAPTATTSRTIQLARTVRPRLTSFRKTWLFLSKTLQATLNTKRTEAICTHVTL